MHRKSLSRFFVLALVAMALMMLVGSVAAVGPTVTPGNAPTGWAESGGMRWKGQAGPDVYLGIPDLGVGGNRVEADAGNPVPAGTYPFTFEYDLGNNDLKADIPSRGVSLTWDLDGSPAPACAPADWDMMLIDVRDGKNTGGLALNNVTLDALTLGTGTFGTADIAATPGHQYWTVTDYDFGAGFVFAGDLEVVGDFNGGEALKIEIIVGCAPPPPSVTPVSEDPLVCDDGTVNIVIDDVENLYGYEFEVEYNDSLVDVVGGYGAFVDDWFTDLAPGLSVAPWDAKCDAGVCKFARTRQGLDATELATTDPQVIASITFGNPVEAGVFDVVVKNVKLTDKDSFEIPGAVGGSLQVNVCGTADVSGQINLQGRPQPGSPFAGISGGTDVDFEVVLDGPFGIFSATPSSTDGTYTVTGVKYLLLGTDYTISADHSIYLQASKVLNVASTSVTGQNTTLLGGDAADDGAVFIEDVACVAGYFGQSALGLDGYVCDGLAFPTSADLNYDDKVNVQDLALVGGNYDLGEDQGW